MKVALVGESFSRLGSLPRAQVELARYLVGAGHDVHVYCDMRQCDATLVSGVDFHHVPSAPYSLGRYRGAWRTYTFVRSASRLITRDRAEFDVVFARGSVTTVCDIIHFPGVYLGERSRGIAAREHGGIVRRIKDRLAPVVYPRGVLRVSIERRLLGRARLIHVDSTLVRDDLVLHYGVHSSRVHVAPTGVNLDEFHPARDRASVRQSLGLPAEIPLVLFVGHDFDRKGLDRLLGAMAKLRNAATLAVVGAGDIDGYRELAAGLGLAESVVFFGGRSDSALFYQAADVLAFPTRVDMWGGPLIEAMASGVPPVTSDAAGAAEAITDGETGLVLPEPLDVDALADALDSLTADPQLRVRMGEAAHEVAKQFSWETVGRGVEAAMIGVASAREPRLRRATTPKTQ